MTAVKPSLDEQRAVLKEKLETMEHLFNGNEYARMRKLIRISDVNLQTFKVTWKLFNKVAETRRKEGYVRKKTR